MEFEYKLAVVIRKDLEMRCGKIAVQVGHGVALAMGRSLQRDVNKWYDEGMKKVVLKVASEEELHALERLCENEWVLYHPIIDFGLTQVDPNTLTGIAIGIDTCEKIDKVTAGLSLL